MKNENTTPSKDPKNWVFNAEILKSLKSKKA
jgi:hypothetical protein